MHQPRTVTEGSNMDTSTLTRADYHALKRHRTLRHLTREELGAPCGLISETYSRARDIQRTPLRDITYATHEVRWYRYQDPYAGQDDGAAIQRHGMTVRLAGFGHAPFGRVKDNRATTRVREAIASAPEPTPFVMPVGLVVLSRDELERAIIGPLGSAE